MSRTSLRLRNVSKLKEVDDTPPMLEKSAVPAISGNRRQIVSVRSTPAANGSKGTQHPSTSSESNDIDDDLSHDPPPRLEISSDLHDQEMTHSWTTTPPFVLIEHFPADGQSPRRKYEVVRSEELSGNKSLGGIVNFKQRTAVYLKTFYEQEDALKEIERMARCGPRRLAHNRRLSSLCRMRRAVPGVGKALTPRLEIVDSASSSSLPQNLSLRRIMREMSEIKCMLSASLENQTEMLRRLDSFSAAADAPCASSFSSAQSRKNGTHSSKIVTRSAGGVRSSSSLARRDSSGLNEMPRLSAAGLRSTDTSSPSSTLLLLEDVKPVLQPQVKVELIEPTDVLEEGDDAPPPLIDVYKNAV